MDNTRLLTLLNKYKDNTCTQDELNELEEWYSLLNSSTQTVGGNSEEALADDMLMQFKKKFARDKSPVIHFYRMISFRVAAASIIILLSIGIYLQFFNTARKNDIVKIDNSRSFDVAAPKATKAIITLANGQTIALDSIKTRTLSKQGNVKVTKTTDGQVVYTGATSEITYNTLTNPRGSTVVNLTLSDGTKVWLNSESSLKYPIAFAGNERKVEITGEAYFEVSKDRTKKFLVDAKGVITEVLGTHFNVNSYRDEANLKITLLEGSVKITKGTAKGLLRPGQQAQVDVGVKVVDAVDVNATIAWKNGLFQFIDADLRTVMRQLARWYDLEVKFEGDFSQRRFEGEIQRELNLTDVLDALSKNQVHYKIEGKKLTVLP